MRSTLGRRAPPLPGAVLLTCAEELTGAHPRRRFEETTDSVRVISAHEPRSFAEFGRGHQATFAPLDDPAQTAGAA